MKHKMSWKDLKFPIGDDDSDAITRKSEGLMHLCNLCRYHPEQLPGYAVHDTRGMFEKQGYNNADVSWADFRQTLAHFAMKSPPTRLSVFHGVLFPPEQAIQLPMRLLAAVLREHVSASSLAEDLLESLRRGQDIEVREFGRYHSEWPWLAPRCHRDERC